MLICVVTLTNVSCVSLISSLANNYCKMTILYHDGAGNGAIVYKIHSF